MIRTLPFFVLLAVLGCDAKPSSTAPGAEPIVKTLGPGDLAPGMTVTRWLQGSPVTIAPGKVYVVDFWASWCGPCRVAMPHLDELARQYGPKGVEVIAVTSLDDQGNLLPRVERYLNEKCKGYQIHFAWCETSETFDAWMGAARLTGIPTSFVIDRHGKIAFIGHPADLDDVLPKVIAGTWRGREDVEAIAEVNGRLQSIFDRVDRAGLAAIERLGSEATPEAKEAAYYAATKLASTKGLEEYAAFCKEHPKKADAAHALSQSMALLMRAGKWDEAKARADKLLANCATTGDEDTLEFVWRNWISKSLNPERKQPGVAVAAAEQVVALRGESEVRIVLACAEANAMAGNKPRAEALYAIARKLTEANPADRAKVEAAIKSFE